MKIKCVSREGKSLPETCRDSQSGFRQDTVFALKLDKNYQVYGLTLFLGHIWYYICDEHYTYYPRWNPSPLFRVVDGRLSKYWRFRYSRSGEKERVVIAFHEWVDDEYYYDKLTDGDKKAVDLFLKYKRLMDKEFESPD